MAFPDVLAMLTAGMTADLGIRTVIDLPPNFTPPLIQVVTITDVPRDKPFNGRALRTTVSVDIFCFGAKTGSNPIGDLRALANTASDWINAWSPQGIVVDETVRPVRRPDFNPNVLRFGSVVEFVCSSI